MQLAPRWHRIAIAATLLTTINCSTEAKLSQAAFDAFDRDLNLSPAQRQQLDQIEKKYAVERAKVDQQENEVREQRRQFNARYDRHTRALAATDRTSEIAAQDRALRQQELDILQRSGDVEKNKRQETMSVLTTEQRAKWIQFHHYLQDK